MSSELQIAGVPFSVSNVTGSIESASTHCPADEATNALSTAPIISVGNPNGRMPSLWLSRQDRHGRFLRDVQGSVQIGIVKDRPQAGNHLSIGLRVIREYTPDCAKHECKKCVAAPQRPQNGGRTDDVT